MIVSVSNSCSSRVKGAESSSIISSTAGSFRSTGFFGFFGAGAGAGAGTAGFGVVDDVTFGGGAGPKGFFSSSVSPCESSARAV